MWYDTVEGWAVFGLYVVNSPGVVDCHEDPVADKNIQCSSLLFNKGKINMMKNWGFLMGVYFI